MRDKPMKSRRWDAGAIAVELAIAAPLLMLMMAGTADFARLFYHSVTLDNASGTGSFYGSQNGVLSADYDGMQVVAKNDAQDLEGVSVTVDRYCACPNKTEKDCFADTCPGFYGETGLYGLPRAYVQVTVQQSFSPLLPWPGIPDSVVITEETFMRAR